MSRPQEDLEIINHENDTTLYMDFSATSPIKFNFGSFIRSKLLFNLEFLNGSLIIWIINYIIIGLLSWYSSFVDKKYG